MKRSTIGAGLLALAIGLSACGAASPSTPANEGGATSGDTTTGGTAGDSSAGGSDTSATSTTGGASDTSATSTTGGASDTSATSTTGDTSATSTTGGTSATSTTGGASATGDTIVDAAIADPRFSTLVSLLEATGLSEQLSQAGPFTIFAPTNEAFTALPAGTLEALAQDPTLLQSILLYHVAEGELTAADVASATSATTAQGSDITISAEGGTVTLNGTAQVIETDIAVGNGVIHVIDQVLLPPDVTLPSGS